MSFRGLLKLILPAALTVTGFAFAGPTLAGLDLRVESWPRTAPIEIFALVTVDGEPVADLKGDDFEISLDGQHLPDFEFRLPTLADPEQNLSIVYVEADSRATERTASAIMQLDVGDYAAIVRGVASPDGPVPWSMAIHQFTRIDDDTGTQSLVDFLALSFRDRAQLRYGSMMSHEDWLAAGLEQLESTLVNLPPGPKALVLQGNGRYINPQGFPAQSELVARANELGIPVFTLATESMSAFPERQAFMAGTADATGGRFGAHHELIRTLLGSAYQVVVPADAVTDCNRHMVEITVRGEAVSVPFERCDRTPDAMVFRDQTRVTGGRLVVSNAVEITGMDAPAEVAVVGGEYSLGCGSTFIATSGIAMPGDFVCVRHAASPEVGATTRTTLIVGGVPSVFYSATSVSAPRGGGGSNSGGGGLAGVMEIFLLLGALLLPSCRPVF